MALNDSEVLHWLREADCEDMLREVPGTELLSLLAHSRYNPLEESSQLAFMAGLERHQEAAFAQLQASPRPPGGLEDARLALYALEIARLQNLIQRLHSQNCASRACSEAADGTACSSRSSNSAALRKECLDRAKAAPR
jgi:hypothetical protein